MYVFLCLQLIKMNIDYSINLKHYSIYDFFLSFRYSVSELANLQDPIFLFN